MILSAIGRLLSAPFYSSPILVVGTGRSGTSVLLQALGQHPLIYPLLGEAPFLTSMGGSAYLFEGGDNASYYLDSLKVGKTYLFAQLRRMGFEAAAGERYGAKRLLGGLLGRGDSPLGKRYWCAKTFPSERVTAGLITLYPSVRFIYIARNGCDVVHSRTRFKGFTHQDFRQHCINWAEGVDKYRHLTQIPESIFVTQESLQRDPRALFGRIFAFLGIADHPAPANYANTTLVHPLDQATQKDTDARNVLSSRQQGYLQWTDEQKGLFKEICSEGMSELGYEVPF